MGDENMNKRYYKRLVERFINANPAFVIVERERREGDGYGGEIIKETIKIKHKVSFYDIKARRETIKDHGKTYTGTQTTIILARYDADIREGELLEYKDRTYKVLGVEFYPGICKQIEIEVVA